MSEVGLMSRHRRISFVARATTLLTGLSLLGLSIGVPAASAAATTVTKYTGTGIGQPWSITTGPDGALWFTNETTNSIGRITTTGTVTNFNGPGISDPGDITAG